MFAASHKYTLKLSPRICAFVLSSPIPSQKSKRTRHKSHNDTLHAGTEFPTREIVPQMFNQEDILCYVGDRDFFSGMAQKRFRGAGRPTDRKPDRHKCLTRCGLVMPVGDTDLS